MRKLLAVTAIVPLLASCAADGRGRAHHDNAAAVEAPQPAPETFALGTSLTRDGAIPQEASGEAFTRGGEIFLSVDVNGASTTQNITVEWLDAKGRLLRRDARVVPEGRRYVPFSSGRTEAWSRGTHRAVVVIDGRRVTERTFALM